MGKSRVFSFPTNPRQRHRYHEWEGNEKYDALSTRSVQPKGTAGRHLYPTGQNVFSVFPTLIFYLTTNSSRIKTPLGTKRINRTA